MADLTCPSIVTTVREAVVDEFLYFVEEVAEFITVCVRINVGDLDRPVRVSVSTVDVTATGTKIL